MKRLLACLMLLCGLPVLAADSTINNLPAITTIPDSYVMPWEFPTIADFHITFANMTNQILSGMASLASQNSASNSILAQIPSTNGLIGLGTLNSASNSIVAQIPSTNGLVGLGTLNSASNSIVGQFPSTNGFVTQSITNGLASTNWVASFASLLNQIPGTTNYYDANGTVIWAFTNGVQIWTFSTNGNRYSSGNFTNAGLIQALRFIGSGSNLTDLPSTPIGLVTNIFTTNTTGQVPGSAISGSLTNNTTGNATSATTAGTVSSISGNTLTSAQVTTGLGYTPPTNTAAGIVTALGYTPLGSTSNAVSATTAGSATSLSGDGTINQTNAASKTSLTYTNGMLIAWSNGIPVLQINATANSISIGSGANTGGMDTFGGAANGVLHLYSKNSQPIYLDAPTTIYTYIGGYKGTWTSAGLRVNGGSGTVAAGNSLQVSGGNLLVDAGNVTASGTGTFTNGVASYATNAVMVTSATGCTNTTGINQLVYVTAATGAALTDCKGTTEFSGVTITSFTPIRLQPTGTFIGTAITYATGTSSHAW